MDDAEREETIKVLELEINDIDERMKKLKIDQRALEILGHAVRTYWLTLVNSDRG